MGDLLKYGKAWAAAAIVSRLSLALAVVVLVAAVVASGGGELHIIVNLGGSDAGS